MMVTSSSHVPAQVRQFVCPVSPKMDLLFFGFGLRYCSEESAL